MANNFTIDKQEYLFKLIPDLSVFDVVERYFIDNDKTNIIENLFFYNIDSTKTISFRRFIIKTNKDVEIKSIDGKSVNNLKDENNNSIQREEIVYHYFNIDEDYFHIIIDEQNKCNGFKVETGSLDVGVDYIIGVCF